MLISVYINKVPIYEYAAPTFVFHNMQEGVGVGCEV